MIDIEAIDVTGTVDPYQYLSANHTLSSKYFILEAEIPQSDSYKITVYDKSHKEEIINIQTNITKGES